VQTGNFDFVLWYVTGASPAAPWARFRDVLDNRGVPKVGEKAFWNYNRYSNAKVPALLDQAAAASEADQKALFAQLDDIYRQDIPVIPLMYRPDEFYEFNESTWTGFPTDAHPSGGAPMFKGAGVFNLNALKPKAG
jgi:peptide/nickel transport system substrate-binding protein